MLRTVRTMLRLREVWLVPVVLPLLSGAAKRGRPTPDQALVEDLRPDRPRPFGRGKTLGVGLGSAGVRSWGAGHRTCLQFPEQYSLANDLGT